MTNADPFTLARKVCDVSRAREGSRLPEDQYDHVMNLRRASREASTVEEMDAALTTYVHASSEAIRRRAAWVTSERSRAWVAAVRYLTARREVAA